MAKHDDSMCLYIGIPLSMRSVRAVSNAAADIKVRGEEQLSDCRWIAPSRYHVTLAYLGWAGPEVVPAIRLAVAQAISGLAPFEMRCADLGAHPSLEEASILWAGARSSADELGALARAVQGACRDLGFADAEREFHPHVTIGRMSKPTNLVSLVQSETAHVFSKTSVESLILYKSSVESDASEHEKIAQWSLRTPLE